jgi:hypothetical protein
MCPVQMISLIRSGYPAVSDQRPAQHHADGLAQQVGRTSVECERQFRGEPPRQCTADDDAEQLGQRAQRAEPVPGQRGLALCCSNPAEGRLAKGACL